MQWQENVLRQHFLHKSSVERGTTRATNEEQHMDMHAKLETDLGELSAQFLLSRLCTCVLIRDNPTPLSHLAECLEAWGVGAFACQDFLGFTEEKRSRRRRGRKEAVAQVLRPDDERLLTTAVSRDVRSARPSSAAQVTHFSALPKARTSRGRSSSAPPRPHTARLCRSAAPRPSSAAPTPSRNLSLDISIYRSRSLSLSRARAVSLTQMHKCVLECEFQSFRISFRFAVSYCEP
jgi:hypothetical protein